MKKILSLALICVFYNTLFSQNLVVNGGFETIYTGVPNPKGYSRPTATSPYAAFSPATNWSSWINNESDNSCMIMEVVNLKTSCAVPYPPDYSQAGGNAMHIISTIGHSGIAQNPLPKNNGVRVTCWVYVVRGAMTIGVINSGNDKFQATIASQTTCKWEKLTVICKDPIDNVTIYSKWSNNQAVTDGAEFYIDNVMVEKL